MTISSPVFSLYLFLIYWMVLCCSSSFLSMPAIITNSLAIILGYNRDQTCMLERFWQEIPPITRAIVLLQILGLALHSFSYADRYDLYFNFDKIVFEGQVWRLLTCFFFVKKLSIYSFLELIFFYHILKKLERGLHKGSIDFLFIVVVMTSLMEVLAALLTINHLGAIFKYAIYYLYGRTNEQDVIMINFMLLRAPYLIWFIFFLDWLMDTPDLKSMVLSIMLGHGLFFFLKVYPLLHFSKGSRPLDAPSWFGQLVAGWFREEDQVQQQVEGFF